RIASRRRPRGVGAHDLGGGRFAQLPQVLADQLDRRRIVVEEGCVRRAARQLAWTRMLNKASRARLAVGRVAWPSGAAMVRPRCLPPTIFSMGSSASVPPLMMGSWLGFWPGPAGLAGRRLQPQQVVERLRRDLV